jgi:hypothetical protein
MPPALDGGATLGRGQIYPLTNYKKGARIWIRDPELVWIGAYLDDDVTFHTKTVSISLENGKVSWPNEMAVPIILRFR